jgi:hypothetical protein
MILKQKKNCKLICSNQKYYIQTNKNLYHFSHNLVEANEYYEHIREIEESGNFRYVDGKFRVELYPEELADILHSIEFYKFSIDKSFYFKCDFESLKAKSFDLSFLYEHLFCIYRDYLKQVEESGRVEVISNTKDLYTS